MEVGSKRTTVPRIAVDLIRQRDLDATHCQSKHSTIPSAIEIYLKGIPR
jgi:hypothetical protein